MTEGEREAVWRDEAQGNGVHLRGGGWGERRKEERKMR